MTLENLQDITAFEEYLRKEKTGGVGGIAADYMKHYSDLNVAAHGFTKFGGKEFVSDLNKQKDAAIDQGTNLLTQALNEIPEAKEFMDWMKGLLDALVGLVRQGASALFGWEDPSQQLAEALKNDTTVLSLGKALIATESETGLPKEELANIMQESFASATQSFEALQADTQKEGLEKIGKELGVDLTSEKGTQEYAESIAMLASREAFGNLYSYAREKGKGPLEAQQLAEEFAGAHVSMKGEKATFSAIDPNKGIYGLVRQTVLNVDAAKRNNTTAEAVEFMRAPSVSEIRQQAITREQEESSPATTGLSQETLNAAVAACQANQEGAKISFDGSVTCTGTPSTTSEQKTKQPAQQH